jgi:outer membrane receptor protein involved in Fe transport
LASDAVVAPGGNIVCRSTLTDPTNGCAPVARIGFGEISAEGLDYITNGENSTSRRQRLRQDVAAVTFATNDIWDNWAGPVSLAFGGEYRREAVDGEVTPTFNPNDRFLYGNYQVTEGSYDVIEGFAETIFPVYEGLDLNGAIRVTNYSTSGTVTTWKLGATWQVIDDFKLRVTRSRDIRAPNLQELFDPGRGRTNTVDVPLAGGATRADTFFEQFTGTTNLDPEVALTWGIGGVFTPTFLPGFAASVDYFDIDLSGAISNITAQQTVNQCFEQNNAAACALITFNGAQSTTTDIDSIQLVPFNFASIRTKGIDIEASYRRPIGDGNMTLRGVASHYINSITDNGIDTPQDEAGQNSGGGVPSWNFRLSANYDTEDWAFNVVGRGFSGGTYDNRFIECESNCPVVGSPERPNADFRTINNNRIAGQWYLDTSITRRFDVGRSRAEVFLYVRNLLNSDPVPVGIGPTGDNTPAYPQTNRVLYDVLGRQFRMGVRFEY